MKKVRFNEHIKVHQLVVWSYAYRFSRKMYWEFYAADRHRFQRRIEETSKKIVHVLDGIHRCKIFNERFVNDK